MAFRIALRPITLRQQPFTLHTASYSVEGTHDVLRVHGVDYNSLEYCRGPDGVAMAIDVLYAFANEDPEFASELQALAEQHATDGRSERRRGRSCARGRCPPAAAEAGEPAATPRSSDRSAFRPHRCRW